MHAGEVLFSSTVVPARFWDDMSWHKVQKSWTRKDDLRIRTVGYKNLKDPISLRMEPSNIWLPSGLFPTCLALRNSGLTVMLRALCPLYIMFTEWVEMTHNKKGRRKRMTAKGLHS